MIHLPLTMDESMTICKNRPCKLLRRVSAEGCVRFSDSPSIHLLPDSPAASSMTDGERFSIWYSPSDIESFKYEAREVGRYFRRQRRIRCRGGSTTSHQPQHTIIAEQEVCTRGVEHKVYPERQRKRNAAVRAVLETQSRLRYLADSCFVQPECSIDPSQHLGYVSRMATQWSRDIALKAGNEDFDTAYPENVLSQNLWDLIDISDFRRTETDEVSDDDSDFEPIPISDFAPHKMGCEEVVGEKRTIIHDNSGRSVRRRISIELA
uniref:Uncharacterized protein n=1 Tax=Helicotheca tamesis TaxID=374047 RepID=A0A7S2N101_9STRA|mmetsp:Transcript_7206/g.9779  ORF Transcript_7206/g.9779 Transcript_7206/m.9779 type:complete len:265 (+) Transcript_7206:47-841(+)